MKILVIGTERDFEECQRKLGDHLYLHRQSHAESEEVLSGCDVVFDFIIDQQPDSFRMYSEKAVTVFLNTVYVSLLELARKADGPMACTIFGFCGFPTLFDRDLLEVALLKGDDEVVLKEIAGKLSFNYSLVDDRVGMVTPRVISMIINEAFYAVQDGTANREDIDLAMKLGTNYPFGPFEWCERIGLPNVFKLLSALYDDTRDERFKVSALMKKECLAANT